MIGDDDTIICVYMYLILEQDYFFRKQQHLFIVSGGARLFMQFQKVGSSPANVHIFLQSSLVLQKGLYSHLLAGKFDKLII